MTIQRHIGFMLQAVLLFVGGCANEEAGPDCGDGLCSGETNATCPADCPITGPTCGDGLCSGETSSTCAADCPASGPFCGDATCNGSETTASCSMDCGAPCSSDPSQAPDNCTGETICVSGVCVAAFPRVYVLRASVDAFSSNGGVEWDPAGGAPDLYLRIGTNAPSAVAQDQFSANFGPIDVPLVQSSLLSVVAADEDGTMDDFVAGCGVPANAAALRYRFFGCALDSGGQRGVLSGVIMPK